MLDRPKHEFLPGREEKVRNPDKWSKHNDSRTTNLTKNFTILVLHWLIYQMFGAAVSAIHDWKIAHFAWVSFKFFTFRSDFQRHRCLVCCAKREFPHFADTQFQNFAWIKIDFIKSMKNRLLSHRIVTKSQSDWDFEVKMN